MALLAFAGECLWQATGKWSWTEKKQKDVIDLFCQEKKVPQQMNTELFMGLRKFHFQGNEIYIVVSACNSTAIGFM